MYLSYTEYSMYGGQLKEAEFDRFAFRAERELDNATHDRLKDLVPIPEAVKRCEYELIMYLSNNVKNGAALSVSSVSNDGYSVSYAEQKNAQAQISDIIYTYLADTDLLYAGVR